MSGWQVELIWWVIVLVLGVVATLLGGPIVEAVFRRVDRARTDEASESAAHPAEPGPSLQQAGEVLRGGEWIGRLERIAVYVSLILAWPSGIAVVLAVKGLARYPELASTSKGSAERFIIGTFVSVLVAAALAGLAHWLRATFLA